MARGEIEIKVTANDDASKKLRGVGDAADDLGRKAGDASGKQGLLGSALDKLGASGASTGEMIAGASVAIAGAAVAAVKHTADLGIEIGHLRDSTGLSADEASRWKEVTDDVGISQGTLETALGKLGKTLGANEKALSKYGVEVVKNADGTVNMSETTLSAIDAINGISDPLKRAEAGAKIFGKGWQGMAELVGQGSDGIRAGLDSVQGSKIFSDESINQSKDVRAGFDAIMDAGEGLVLTIGKALAPTIAKLAPKIGELIEKAEPLATAIGELLVSAFDALEPVLNVALDLIGPVAKALAMTADAVTALSDALLGSKVADDLVAVAEAAKQAGWSNDEFAAAMKRTGGDLSAVAAEIEVTKAKTEGITDATDEASDSFDRAASSSLRQAAGTRSSGDAAKDAAPKIKTFSDAAWTANFESERLADNLAKDRAEFELLMGTLDNNAALLNLKTSFNQIETAADEAFAAAADGSKTAEQASIDYQLQVNALKEQVAQYGREVLGLPAEQITKMTARIDEGWYQAVESRLAFLARNRPVVIGGQIVGSELNNAKEGRTNSAGFAPGEPSGATSGTTVNNFIEIRTGADERRTVAAVKQYVRRGGTI